MKLRGCRDILNAEFHCHGKDFGWLSVCITTKRKRIKSYISFCRKDIREYMQSNNSEDNENSLQQWM